MPVRFTSPGLGASSGAGLNEGQWEVGLLYRYLHANRFYVGHDYHPERAPAGMPVRITVNTVVANLTYAPNSRFALNLGIPVVSGSETRAQGDNQLHTGSAAGLGDMSVIGTAWLLDRPDHPLGNVAIGLGLKTPTGRSARQGSFTLASGATASRSVDPSIQTGDGGWGVIVQTEAFRRVFPRVAMYEGTSYLANPRAHNNGTYVFGAAYGGLVAPIAVPDEYSAHAGLSFAALPKLGLSMSFGGRIDGVPVHDVLGGGDDDFRRPGYVVYAEPAFALTWARSPLSPKGTTLSMSVPVAIDQNRQASAIDAAHGQHGGGDFARYLILLGLSTRF
jgi:hypothetical protein